MKKLLFFIGFILTSCHIFGYRDADKIINQILGPNASVQQKWNMALELKEYDWIKYQIKNNISFKKMANNLLIKYLKNGDLESAETLLSFGADPNGYNDSIGKNIFLNAINSKNMPEAKLLLKYGANPNLTTYDNLRGERVSILELAVYDHDLALMELLLNFKANPNLNPAKNYPPLNYAIMELGLLIQSRDFNNNNTKEIETLIDIAIILLQHGAITQTTSTKEDVLLRIVNNAKSNLKTILEKQLISESNYLRVKSKLENLEKLTVESI